MANRLLMPKATAVWLVDNTALTFDQIAQFCNIHPLEVKTIADGETAQGIKGMDPLTAGQLTREEISRGERDPNYKLKLSEPKIILPEKKRRGPRYTPLSRRQDRPNAILWLVRNHPEMTDAQISHLLGTTKHTIEQIRDRTHWNAANLTPMDPVTLGLCSQIELDIEVEKAAKNKPQPAPEDATLLPARATENLPEGGETEREAQQRADALEESEMLSKLASLGEKHEEEPHSGHEAADEKAEEK